MDTENGTVLVVDDNEMNRDMLVRRLQRRGFTVITAENGFQALESIDRPEVEIVVLDVMMPGIDGLEVLEIIRRTRSVADLPVIMATAKDQSEDVIRALRLGANDYVTKPLDFEVVLARIMTQLSVKRAKKALEAAHARMKADLEAAARIQQALMPHSLPDVPGVRFGWRFKPCDELAGDILDIIRLGETSLGLYMLDVSGHGVPAALLSVTLSRVLSMADGASLLREEVPNSDAYIVPPLEVARRLNRRFPVNPETRQYFTLLYGVLDLKALKFRYVCAGHPAPILIRQDNVQIEEAYGFPIGWFPDPNCDERTIRLSPGDRVYIYSDGVIEAKNRNLELFEVERLTRSLVALRSMPFEDSLDALLHEVRKWCGDAAPDDDITVLGFEIEGQPS